MPCFLPPKEEQVWAGGRMPGSLAGGLCVWEARVGCLCPGGENNTLVSGTEEGQAVRGQDEGSFPFLALGTNHSVKIS